MLASTLYTGLNGRWVVYGWQKNCMLSLIRINTKKSVFSVLFPENKFWRQYLSQKLSTVLFIVPLFLNLSQFWSQTNITACFNKMELGLTPPMQRLNFWNHFLIIDSHPLASGHWEAQTEPLLTSFYGEHWRTKFTKVLQKISINWNKLYITSFILSNLHPVLIWYCELNFGRGQFDVFFFFLGGGGGIFELWDLIQCHPNSKGTYFKILHRGLVKYTVLPNLKGLKLLLINLTVC